MTRKKRFDCVEMKRKGARSVYAATKDMTAEEETAYWRERTVAARRWIEEKRNTGVSAPPHSSKSSTVLPST